MHQTIQKHESQEQSQFKGNRSNKSNNSQPHVMKIPRKIVDQRDTEIYMENPNWEEKKPGWRKSRSNPLNIVEFINPDKKSTKMVIWWLRDTLKKRNFEESERRRVEISSFVAFLKLFQKKIRSTEAKKR